METENKEALIEYFKNKNKELSIEIFKLRNENKNLKYSIKNLKEKPKEKPKEKKYTLKDKIAIGKAVLSLIDDREFKKWCEDDMGTR